MDIIVLMNIITSQIWELGMVIICTLKVQLIYMGDLLDQLLLQKNIL